MNKNIFLISFLLFLSGCANKEKLKVTPLAFYDISSFDSGKQSNLKYKSLHFVVEDPRFSYKDYNKLDSFINNDSIIQKNIDSNFGELTLSFYRKSANTELLKSTKSYKYIYDANNDLALEYYWKNGSPYDTLFYKNGKMVGYENLQLRDIQK
jgi:hypothetical protein